MVARVVQVTALPCGSRKPCKLSQAELLTTNLGRRQPLSQLLYHSLERGLPKLAEKALTNAHAPRHAHKLAWFAFPAHCYHRHVVVSLSSFCLCSLRRVNAAGLCELPENGLLARLRGRRVGRPPRRLRRV